MNGGTRTLAAALAVSALAGGVLVRAGQPQEPLGLGQTPTGFPLSQTIRERGSSLTGAFEGWYYDRDGSQHLLVGYFNRNVKQEFDIPIGPNNRIDPGGPDFGQPTHFVAGRQWGLFSIHVPKDFGKKKLTWTLVANGFTNSITLHTLPDWIVEPYRDAANGNTPPVLRFEPNGQTFTGPPSGIAATYVTTLPNPVMLTTWVSDEGPTVNVPAPPGRGRGASAVAAGLSAPARISLTWSKFTGPGPVMFANDRPPIDSASGSKAETTATFETPGEYMLRAQSNDSTGVGGGGFQCCWTNAYVKVTVKPGTTR